MQENFEKIMEFIFKWEGFKSDDPDDIGGRTVWGIAEKFYPVDVPLMWEMEKWEAQDYAKTIYHRDYWNKVDGDNLVKGLDAFIMDAAVNMGVSYANGLKHYEMNNAFIERMYRYVQIAAKGNNIKFLRGWLRRLYDLYQFIKQNI